MAHEKNDPNSKAILLWTVLSVLILMGLYPLLHSYFESMFDRRYEQSLVGSTAEKDAYKQEVQEALKNQQKYVEQVAASGPTGVHKVESGLDGLGSVRGWSENKDERAYQAAAKAIGASEQRIKEAKEEADLAAVVAGALSP